MRVLILGVGDAFTRLHFGSSALIEGPEGHVLLDCPDLVHRALHEATNRAGWNVNVLDVHDILLTHLHGDHCNGLESFGFAHRIHRIKTGASAPPRLHTSRPTGERLWERLAPAMDAAASADPRTIDHYFDLRLVEPQTPARVGGLEVQCRFTRHPVPTVGLLISDGATTLGWSGDTSFDPEHIDWLSRADVIVHECNVGPVHTPLEQLEGLAEDVRRRIRLIHLPDDFDPSTTTLAALEEGDVLEV